LGIKKLDLQYRSSLGAIDRKTVEQSHECVKTILDLIQPEVTESICSMIESSVNAVEFGGSIKVLQASCGLLAISLITAHKRLLWFTLGLSACKVSLELPSFDSAEICGHVCEENTGASLDIVSDFRDVRQKLGDSTIESKPQSNDPSNLSTNGLLWLRREIIE